MLAAWVAVVGVLLWRADWSAFDVILGSSAWVTLISVAGLFFLAVPAKLVVWAGALSCTYRNSPRIRDLVGGVLVGSFVNAIAPARVGDVVRIALTRRRLARRGARLPLPALAGSVIGESLISAVGWALFVATAALIASVPGAAKAAGVTLIVVAVAVCLAGARGWGFGSASTSPAGRVRRFAREVWQSTAATGLALLRRPLRLIALLFVSLGSWLAQLVAILLLLTAFEVDRVGIEGAVLVVVAISTAQLIPVLPGNSGLVPAAVALALSPFGVPTGAALALGLTVPMLQFAGLLVGGVLGIVWDGVGMAETYRLSKEADRREPLAVEHPPGPRDYLDRHSVALTQP